ncbi:DUF2235 domain-containing protein [Prauserella flavalba]|uniref:T6SS Phospholipase effector Tle1-like catalytic domain-containing protein n=1 Tax=Prauserella flavalba TaxID=1477506 RepID=A0A318MAE4_9PSEU|nr:DUF2235 domain-containing protein [Prauserella flavalba]PXY35799.1 hypothetical protein BA062_09970 [Prauserella flavalba]
MAKRLVVLCDGTWNTLTQRSPTNVARLKAAVAPVGADGVKQQCRYLEGVGTKPWQRLLGGAFGYGLSANVKAAYEFLVHHYEPGDELFFFGFSRGAYTARSTVGFIVNCGILRPQHAGRLDEAYELYRDRDRATAPGRERATRFRASFAHENQTPVEFVGVWDTVGALGIPLSGGRLLHRFNQRWQFHDTTLSHTVRAAFQALAVDEHRRSFTPAVWQVSSSADGQRREQVWFAGDHSDVGGGHSDTALADIALRWLAGRARDRGLGLEPDALARLPRRDECGTLHDTWRTLTSVLGRDERRIGVTDRAGEYAASSAVFRRERMRPPYAPRNLVDYLGAAGQVIDV